MTDPQVLVRRMVQGHDVSAEPLDGTVWPAFESLVRRERLEGYRRLAILEGRLAATDEQRARAEDQLVATMERSVAIEAMVGWIVQELGGHGVDVVALKGLAACRLDRPAPELRSFFDADLLVRPEQLDTTYAVLHDLGLARRFVEPVPGFDARFGKGSAFVDDGGRELDLHRTLAMGSLGISVDAEELWEGAVPIEIAGRPLYALSAEARLLHACVHAAASSEPPRWHTLLDMGEIERRGVIPERVAALARSWRYDAVVRRAVELHHQMLGAGGVPVLADIATSLRSTRLQELTLAAYRRPGTGYASRSMLALPVIQSWRDRGRFLRALAAPRHDYVSHHHRGRTDRWRSALRDVAALAGRRR